MNTPISKARNLGPVSEVELESVGITSLEQMVEMGWENVCLRYVEMYPSRLNLNAFTSIIGAIYDQDWRKIDPDLKIQAKKLIQGQKIS